MARTRTTTRKVADERQGHDVQAMIEQLLAEVRELRAEVEQGRQREAATYTILQAISGATTDVRTVLEGIAQRAATLCGTETASVVLTDGDVQWHGAVWPAARSEEVGLRTSVERPAKATPLNDPESFTSHVLREGRTLQVSDMQGAEGDRYAGTTQRFARRVGARAYLAAPMLRQARVLGYVGVTSMRARRYSDSEVRLLESFASQAVIAIENARLFVELQERLAEQSATSELLRVIAASPSDSTPVLDAVTESAARLLGAVNVRLWLRDGAELHAMTAHGHWGATATPVGDGIPLDRRNISAATVLGCRTIHVQDMWAEPCPYPLTQSRAKESGLRSALAVPLRKHGEAIGALVVWRAEPLPFTPQQVTLLESFADQAVIAIENARLFSELQVSNRTLTEALEQQTATSEILQAISRSPADLDPVLDAIAESAARLCAGANATIRLAEEGRFRDAAHYGDTSIALRRGAVHPISPDTLHGLAFAQRRTIHVPDTFDIPELPARAAFYRQRGSRWAIVVAPLLREGEPIGVINVRRERPEPFTKQQVTLLETFAAQAVIAIENTRLFRELQERDDRRRRELERASAIQQRLLPAEVDGWPGILEIAVRFRPAVETSGDFYDMLRLTPATEGGLPPLQIAVGDVAGKGMSAALVTALARSALRSSTAIPTEVVTSAGILRLAGRRLHQDVGSSHFVACALAVVEPPGRHNAGPLLRLANAAQVPVLLVRNGAIREIEPPGYRLPLGAQDDGAYKDVEEELRPGDVVVFSSDGLVEAPARGELFGFERLAQTATHWSMRGDSAESVAEGIWSDVTGWCGEESHHDDMTLLVLRVPTT